MKKTILLVITGILLIASGVILYGCGKSTGFGPGVTIVGGSS